MNILFICTGNTCRSPMAEGIFKKLAENNNLDIEIKSAGINAFDGDNIASNAIRALENIGIDISHYKSTLVHDELVEEADLILTMSKAHREVLNQRFPQMKNKILLLNEYAFNTGKDIEDPFGGSLRDYETARDEIYRAIKKIVDNGQLTIDN